MTQFGGADPRTQFAIERKRLTMIFIVDQSGSMSGTKIASVNTAIEQVLPELQGQCGVDADIYINALTFSNDATWLFDDPAQASNVTWPVVSAYGMTAFDLALKRLNERLTRKNGGFFKDDVAHAAPILILLSDGEANNDSYKSELAKLQQNAWFRNAMRVAVAIGQTAGTDRALEMLEAFTGSRETIINVYSPAQLKQMIRVVSMTASRLGSHSQGSQNGQAVNPNEALANSLSGVTEVTDDGTRKVEEATVVIAPEPADDATLNAGGFPLNDDDADDDVFF